MTIREMLSAAEADGYHEEYAEAKVCQDIVLKALSLSTLSRNATIKGGVVMRSFSRSSRRATQDIDIDFIRYSLDDKSVMRFIEKLNCISGIAIEMTGQIEELRQQDYHGKRIYVNISDDDGYAIKSKIDLGVHKDLNIDQEEYCFDIACFDGGANLLINSKEQMFAEKLRSILRFGPNSTRYKDIFDMCYLSRFVEKEKLHECLKTFIFDDAIMRENNTADIVKRVKTTFENSTYIKRLSTSRKNWLDMPIQGVTTQLLSFLEEL